MPYYRLKYWFYWDYFKNLLLWCLQRIKLFRRFGEKRPLWSLTWAALLHDRTGGRDKFLSGGHLPQDVELLLVLLLQQAPSLLHGAGEGSILLRPAPSLLQGTTHEWTIFLLYALLFFREAKEKIFLCLSPFVLQGTGGEGTNFLHVIPTVLQWTGDVGKIFLKWFKVSLEIKRLISYSFMLFIWARS